MSAIKIQLANDWYGPDHVFRRVSDNPHSWDTSKVDLLPPTTLLEVDGNFVPRSEYEVEPSLPLSGGEGTKKAVKTGL